MADSQQSATTFWAAQDVVRLSTERAALRIKLAAAEREAARLRQELQEVDALLSAAQESAAAQASPGSAGDTSPQALSDPSPGAGTVAEGNDG